MSEDMDTKGIYFDLQWKTKSGSSNVEEFGSIGIWEVDDSSLDWFAFKPYLCQTLGNLENVSISYVDSDGDEIPIDSDLEFQEALKYARRKAAMHQKIVLKVEKLDDQSAATGGVELLNNPIYLKSSNFFKERLKINCNSEDIDLIHLSSGDVPVKVGNPACKVKTKPKSKDILCPLQSCETPPLWFKKYMKKMKSEIISEVTANVNSQMKKLLEDIGQKTQPMIFPIGSMNSNGSQVANGKSSAWLVTKTKKKISDGESSDGAPKVEIRDSKIMRKIEKLDRRERKLDHKKEKLEQKTRKIAERKEREYLSKLRLEIAGCKPSHVVSRAYNKVGKSEVASFPMPTLNVHEITQNQISPKDLENAPVGVTVNADDMHMMTVKRGSNFTKVWKVTNSGGAKWTDETEVKLSWGNTGLNPKVTCVKCPPLAPGEEGEISIDFSSPLFPGVFESHWHFYHKNVRFGGRMSCLVTVDLIKREEEPNCDPRTQSLSPSSSTEFIVVHPTSVGNDGSNFNAGDEDLQKDSAIIPKTAPSGSANIDEPLEKSDPFSMASGPWEKEEKIFNEDKCSFIGENQAELDSLSSDDMSGSEHSLGSDSEDNFVVVPMPPCFRIDIPLNSGGPSAVETISEETANPVAEPENPSLSKAPESPPPMHLPSAPLEPCRTSDGNAQSPDYSHLSEIPLQREVSHDTGEVISVPLIPPQPSASTAQFQPAVTPMSPKCPEPRVIILNKPNQSPPSSPAASQRASPTTSAGSSSASDHSTSSSSSAKSSASSRSSENTRSGGRDRGVEKPVNIPQAKTSPRPPPRPSPRPTQSSSRPIDLKPRSVTEVINGAISVTSSAINTAFAALDSILENPAGVSVTPGTVYRESPNTTPPQRPRAGSHEDPPPPPIDPVMAAGLTKLANMGFVDLELNQALLRVYNHNLPEVIESLLNGRP